MCTAATYLTKDFYFGRTLDYDFSYGEELAVTPRKYPFLFRQADPIFDHYAIIGIAHIEDGIPLFYDGMNEKGLAVSVNMIQDTATISQNTDKPDITTTTAIRLLLNQAADVGEAVELLKQYDMHASMGYMMHLAISDRGNNSVVIEYVNNEMIVVETFVVTNFYLAKGEKNGIGTQQSHERYDILMNILTDNKTMNINKVKNALDSVSKKNFGEFESTEWSIVWNQSTGEAIYYHRENYEKPYIFQIEQR